MQAEILDSASDVIVRDKCENFKQSDVVFVEMCNDIVRKIEIHELATGESFNDVKSFLSYLSKGNRNYALAANNLLVRENFSDKHFVQLLLAMHTFVCTFGENTFSTLFEREFYTGLLSIPQTKKELEVLIDWLASFNSNVTFVIDVDDSTLEIAKDFRISNLDKNVPASLLLPIFSDKIKEVIEAPLHPFDASVKMQIEQCFG